MSQIRLFLLIILFSNAFGQLGQKEKPNYLDFQVSSERYLTDKNGNVAMYVNNFYPNTRDKELDESGYEYWVVNLSNIFEQKDKALLGFL